ncbi:MAG: hypothetical protein QXX95_06835 [Nitrososphaerales archaeon]
MDFRDEIKVRLKKGAWEVEITCSQDKLKDAIETVLSTLDSIQTVPEVKKESIRVSITCKGLIEELWKEGWFATERSLSEVHEELGRRGYHYDKTAVSHSLADLVRENVLTRVGSMRNYKYIQKKPL